VTITHDAGTRPWVILTVVGVIVYVLIDVVLALVRPEFSLIRDFESDYGRGRKAWIMDVDFVVRGVLFASALVVLARRRIAQPWTGVLLAVWAVASALLAFFPTDIVGWPRVPSGPVHTTLAGIGFLASAIATFAMSLRVQRQGAASHGVAVTLLVLTSLGLLFFVGQGVAPLLGLAGADERLFLATQLAFALVACIATTTIPRSTTPRGTDGADGLSRGG
jgi:hypothetical membrane protein